MREDGIWKVYETHAIAEIMDAELVVLKNLVTYGFRWCAAPKRQGCVIFENRYESDEENSEVEPYPTMEVAMDACERFYSWEWHGVR